MAVFYVTIKVVAACVPARAGINKAPTFGVLNRIKMCVAALLSSPAAARLEISLLPGAGKYFIQT